MAITGKFEADFSSFVTESAKATTALGTVEAQATSTAVAANTIGAASSGASAGVLELTTATTALAGAQDVATLTNAQLDAMIAGETVALTAATAATTAATTASGAYGAVLFTTAEAEVVATEATVGLGAALTAAATEVSAFVATLAPWLLAIGVAVELIKHYVDAQREATKAEAERINKQEILAEASRAAGKDITNLAEAVKVLTEAQRHQLLLNPDLAAQSYIDHLSKQAKTTMDLAAEEAARNEGLAKLGLVVGENVNVEQLMTEARRKAAEAAREQQRENQKYFDSVVALTNKITEMENPQRDAVFLAKDLASALGTVSNGAKENIKDLTDFQNTLAKMELGLKASAATLRSLGIVDNETIPRLKEHFRDAEEERKKFDKGMKELEQSFNRLASVSGGLLGGVIRDFARMADAAVVADQAIAKLGDSTSSVFDKISSATDLISAGIQTAKALYDIFKGIGGPSAAEQAGRSIVANLESQFGSTADFINKVGDAYVTIGKTREQAQIDIKKAWDAEVKGAQEATAAVNVLNEALKRSNEIESDIGSLGIKSHDELVHAADIANTTYQKIFDGVKTGQYTAEDATKAYLAYQEALAATGNIAAQAWLKSQQAATAGATAVDAATSKLISQRDALTKSISQEAPEAQIGVIEQQQRAQRDALDQQIKDAQAAAEAQATTADDAAKSAQTSWQEHTNDWTDYVHAKTSDTAGTMRDDFVDAAGDAASGIKGQFDFTIHIPIAFDTPSLPVSPQALGGDYLVTKPTLFLAGEAGPERATFTPQGQSAASSGSNGPIVVQVVLDGRVVAENTINRMAQDKYGAGIKTKRALGLIV